MLEINSVSVRIGDAQLLRPITASVPPGENLFIRGANGSGKTTLLRVLAGERTPSAGSVTMYGSTISNRSRAFRRCVSSMIGPTPLAADLTVREHVVLVATTWLPKNAVEEASTSIISSLRLSSVAQHFPHELSSGQSCLLSLALGLVRPFDVLILDEPEQRLDSEHLGLVIDVLADRAGGGATLVAATHSSILTTALAGQVLTLGEAS